MKCRRTIWFWTAVVLLHGGCGVTASPPAKEQAPPPEEARSKPGLPPLPQPGAACIAWRQTGSCEATGPREPGNDKACDATIEPGWSGFCECAGGVVGTNCDHPQNNCKAICQAAMWSKAPPPAVPQPGAACIGWRQTGDCKSNGPREPGNDKGCDASIESGWSGFCECAGGTVGVDCDHAPATCAQACRSAAWP
jgi:hypothetical protein